VVYSELHESINIVPAEQFTEWILEGILVFF
jgi:hypothetical protein